MLSMTYSALAELYKTINTVLCAGTVLSYTAEYTKAKEMGFFLSRDFRAHNDCQKCKHDSNSFPTRFMFLFPEIFLTNLLTENTYTFSKT